MFLKEDRVCSILTTRNRELVYKYTRVQYIRELGNEQIKKKNIIAKIIHILFIINSKN